MAGSTNIDKRLWASINRRSISILCVIVAVCFAVAYKLFLIHGVYGDKLKAKQYAVTHRAVLDMPQRGQIFDRFGYGLALNTPEVEIWIDQKNVAWSDADVALFAKVFNQDHGNVATWFKVHRKTYRKYSTTDWSTYESLRIGGLKGIYPKVRFSRFYPLRSAAAQVLGKINASGKGAMGLEYAFENTLTGDPQKHVIKHDRHGRAMKRYSKYNALKKQSLHTTIDHRIQHYAFESLREMVEKSSAKAGSVVVLDRNGDIHAMVNYPSYDPNFPIEKIDSKLKNKAYIDLFEPGSIIKPIALAALLDAKMSDEKSFFTGNGKFKFMGHYVTDTSPAESVKLKDILIKSSNIAMVKLAQNTQNKNLIEGLKDFSLFDTSGIHLYGEPINHDYAEIKRDSASYLTASYGYGIHVTLLRIAHAYLILAKEGVDPGVRLVHNNYSEEHRVVDLQIAKRVNNMMLSAVMKNGTGRRARVDGVNVAGKTGTTHKHAQGGYDKDAHIASFVGFAPAENPQFVVAVMLDEPKGNLHYGGTSCAPLFRDIMDYALKVRVVSPQIAYDKGVRDATNYN